MAGRKRKAGDRTPSGQLSRAQQETKFAPAAIKRLAEQAIAKASDPRLGSEIGRLMLAGKLTARQAAAGWRFAEISADYSKALQSPKLKTARLERGQRGQDAEEGTSAGEAISRALVRSVRRAERALAALSAAGKDSERAVDLLAADVALLTYEQLVAARAGLDALASLFATY